MLDLTLIIRIGLVVVAEAGHIAGAGNGQGLGFGVELPLHGGTAAAAVGIRSLGSHVIQTAGKAVVEIGIQQRVIGAGNRNGIPLFLGAGVADGSQVLTAFKSTHADLGYPIPDQNGFQIIAIPEGIAADGLQRPRQRHPLQIGAVGKGLVQGSNTLGHHHLRHQLAIEIQISGIPQGVGGRTVALIEENSAPGRQILDMDLLQAAAAGESAVAHGGDRSGDIDALQRSATVKQVAGDLGQALGQIDLLQIAAAGEGIAADGLDGSRDIDLGDIMVCEGKIADAGDAIGQGHGFYIIAIGKGIATHAGGAGLHHNVLDLALIIRVGLVVVAEAGHIAGAVDGQPAGGGIQLPFYGLAAAAANLLRRSLQRHCAYQHNRQKQHGNDSHDILFLHDLSPLKYVWYGAIVPQQTA